MVSIVVLAIICLAGPALAMMPSADAHCSSPECQAAFRCSDGLPSIASAPVAVRAELPVGLLFAVDDIPPPDTLSVIAGSAEPTLARRSSGPLASRSPPSLF